MTPFTLRAPCQKCGSTSGAVTEKSGQDMVFCSSGHWCYNAPKTETGRKPRSVSTTHELIRPSVRARVLAAAGGMCHLCGAHGKPLHISHALSVADGHEMGLSDDEINHEDNLFAFCDECNLGLGRESLSARLYAILLRRRAARIAS